MREGGSKEYLGVEAVGDVVAEEEPSLAAVFFLEGILGGVNSSQVTENLLERENE